MEVAEGMATREIVGVILLTIALAGIAIVLNKTFHGCPQRVAVGTIMFLGGCQ